MGDEGSDEELAKYFGAMPMPGGPAVPRPAAPVPRRRAPGPAPPIFEPVPVPRRVPRRQGTKRKVDRMLSGMGRWKNELRKAHKFFTSGSPERGLPFPISNGNLDRLLVLAEQEMDRAERSTLDGFNPYKKRILAKFIDDARQLTGRIYNPRGSAEPKTCKKCGGYK